MVVHFKIIALPMDEDGIRSTCDHVARQTRGTGGGRETGSVCQPRPSLTPINTYVDPVRRTILRDPLFVIL